MLLLLLLLLLRAYRARAPAPAAAAAAHGTSSLPELGIYLYRSFYTHRGAHET